MVVEVDREQVIAYRIAAQGLHRDAKSLAGLAVLDIGVQEAMGQPAGLAFAARLPEGKDTPEIGPDTDLALAWSLRGAPHVHRRRDLDGLAAALWPLSEADAAGRLNETGPSVKRAGISALDQFRLAVKELRAVVPKATAKGVASTEVSKRIPAAMRRDCRPCKASHISDSAMRAAALPAGLELEPGTAPPVLLRRPKAKRPDDVDAAALARLIRSYLEMLGPATYAEVAGYLDARRADLDEFWPEDELAAVSLGGRRAWMPPGRLSALKKPPEPDLVRLLGPFDPYLQARDRTMIVPDKSVHKALWPVLGRPGALLVDGEIAGIWRTRATAKKLTITVETFGSVPAAAWKRVDAEAERVARVRGAADVAVVGKK